MDAFGIEDGTCGAGTARYAAGLITLPDGARRGVEEILRIAPDDAVPRPGSAQRASEVAGSVREVLGTGRSLALPLRLALSTMRAGLGAIEEGLRPPDTMLFEIAFADGSTIKASMPPRTAALIRRDAEIARGALARAAQPAPAPETGSPADEAVASLFRYEKRNGRLRRIAAGEPGD